MRKGLTILLLAGMVAAVPAGRAEAQAALVAQVIKEGVKKAITAVDLKIQRLQTKTVMLENAQKVLENTMSKLKLQQIAGWVQKQRDLYQAYYQELWKVKEAVTVYEQVTAITREQAELLREYERAWKLFGSNPDFRPEELSYMEEVYSGILSRTAANVSRLTALVKPFETRMSDAARMEMIRETRSEVEGNYHDLLLFNRQNMLLSLERARQKGDVQELEALYGLQ
jgi:hypothetical protein